MRRETVKKFKGELFTCIICGKEVERIRSWQYDGGRACRTHPKARPTPQPLSRPAQLIFPVGYGSGADSQTGATRLDTVTPATITSALHGRPRGSKVRITLEDGLDGFVAAGFLVLMKDTIVEMDDRTFFDLYAVGVSQRWEHIPRTVEVTLNFRGAADLRGFASLLGQGEGVSRLEVV